MLQKAPGATHTHFIFNILLPESVTSGVILKKDLCIACWIAKATITYSEYVVVNSFTVQQWLHKCADC